MGIKEIDNESRIAPLLICRNMKKFWHVTSHPPSLSFVHIKWMLICEALWLMFVMRGDVWHPRGLDGFEGRAI